jgi:ubiquinone/menaquinone biosynthesis C-methylase UbiE
VSEQYATDVNLRARIDLHQRFSTSQEDWHRRLFDRVAPPAGARILEVGCGPAEFWKRNLDRIDPSWEVTLSDQSAGMIESARSVLGDGAEYAVADVGELPFADESFDVLMAHHMLYHVPDRPRAFAEIRRVLVPGGKFHAATNGAGHLDELGALYDAPFHEHLEAFGLETGPPQLAPFFADIEVERFEGELRVTEVEPVLAYIRSSFVYDGTPLDEAAETVSAAITRDGAFRIGTCAGLISCRKP